MSNPFESGARKLIPAVLLYARCEDEVLMIHRNSGRSADYHSGKWNGLGGKLEQDESFLQAAQREFFEEAGVQLPESHFKPLGIVQFPLFKAHKSEDWWVSVFEIEFPESLRSSVLKRSDEGELHWVKGDDLMKLNLWEGDRHFLPWVIDRKPFLATIWYEGQKVKRWWVRAMLV